MKYKLIYCYAIIICMAFIGCSDDSDKIDAFFKEKISKYESVQPTAFVCSHPNAVWYVSNGSSNQYFQINTNKEKLSSEIDVTWYGEYIDSEKENNVWSYYYVIQDLEPATTYYYRQLLETSEQVSISERKTIFSAIQSFTTPELTAGEIVFNSKDVNGYPRVQIRPGLFLNRHSHVKVTVEYSLSSSFTNSEQSYDSSWYDEDYYNYVTLYSLAPNTKYYYRLIVTINNKDFRSPISSFTTVSK